MSAVARHEQGWGGTIRVALVVAIVLLLLAPSVVILPMSFSESRVLAWPPRGFTLDWYVDLFASGQWMKSARHSLEVAAVSSAIAVLVGVPAGVTLGLRDWPLKDLTLAIVMVPLVIPTVVLAIGMYKVYVWLGLYDLWGLAAAHAVIGVPFVVVTTMSATRQLNPVLPLAARSLGAGPVRTFFLVILPGIRGGVLSGALFAFATSWDEVVIANFLSSPTYRTIPVQMWAQITERVDPTVAAMATVLFVLSLAMAATTLLPRRRAG